MIGLVSLKAEVSKETPRAGLGRPADHHVKLGFSGPDAHSCDLEKMLAEGRVMRCSPASTWNTTEVENLGENPVHVTKGIGLGGPSLCFLKNAHSTVHRCCVFQWLLDRCCLLFFS